MKLRKEDAYRRNEAEAHKLFLEVIEDLNGYGYEILPAVLEKICRFFSFGCAFVYESDHLGDLHLKERYTTYKNPRLYEKFKLSDALTPEESLFLYRAPVIFFNEKGGGELQKKLSALFDAGALLLMPITDAGLSVVGFVGIVDRRSGIRMTEDEISMSSILFKEIASHVKMRFYQKRLHYAETSLKSIMDNTGIDIYVKDFYTDELLYTNASVNKRLGGAPEKEACFQAFYGESAEKCGHCPQDKLLDENGSPAGSYTCDYKRPDGAWVKIVSAAFKWVDGRLAQVVSSIDITESKRNEEIIENMAFIDSVTGIPNRRKLQKDVEEFLSSPEQNKKAALMFIDLDGFKTINDDLGHAAGDKLLEEVANFLQYESVAKDRAYRYGGDEFLLFFTGENLDVHEIAERVLEGFARKWEIDGSAVKVGASIGIARYPEDAADYRRLIDKADMAMYKAKALGKGRASFIEDFS